MAGMTLASIVCGNTVILKPSSDSPTIAAKFLEILEEAGMPEGVVNFCPGSGATFGNAIVEHPKTRFIALTGSRDVGLEIHERAAKQQKGQIWIKRTILEMGGKDSIIVDADANLDAAVEGVDVSAFGLQGQKWTTLEDLRSQLQQVKKMGPLSSLVSMIPGAGKINEEDIDEKAIHRMQAILDSMTKKEREFPQLINGSRKKRIAKGSGTSVQEINSLLKQYLQMKKMMRTFSKGMGARRFGKMMKGLPPEFLH